MMSKRKITIKEIKQIWRMVTTNIDMSADELQYIAEYLEKYPGKKLTRFLRWKLRREARRQWHKKNK